jgi:hypothetical protein
MSTTMDDLAALSARRKGDRQVMALRLVNLTGEYKLVANWIPEVKGSRRTHVDIEGPHGLKLSVRFDGNGSDPDTYVLSWHGVEDVRLAPGKFYSVNKFHGHKATDVAYGWAQLMNLLRRRFAAVRDGSAFEPDAAHVATVAPDAGGYLVSCRFGCNLGLSAHVATEAAAASRVELHYLTTAAPGPAGRRVYVVTFAAERDRHDLGGLRRMLKSEAVGLLASAQRSGAVVNADTGQPVVTS